MDARGWGPLDMPGFPPLLSGGETVHLIDVADRVPRGAYARSGRRLEEYAGRGWDVTGGARGAG